MLVLEDLTWESCSDISVALKAEAFSGRMKRQRSLQEDDYK